ncbi:MAG: Mur ligase domain-containing protein, partial [Desulfobaccales bacterium]
MTTSPPLHIHLLGICGTGMAALAGILQELGYRVTGSDEHVYPPMSTFLEGLGIPIQDGYQPENLDPRPDLVVVG